MIAVIRHRFIRSRLYGRRKQGKMVWLDRVPVFKSVIGFGPAQVLCGDLRLIFQWRGEPHDEDDVIESNSPFALVFFTFKHSEIIRFRVPHKHS
jgi:hypothetical protein